MGNLVITRRSGEKFNIGGSIDITIEAIRGERATISISAPKDIPVYRHEVLERLQREQRLKVRHELRLGARARQGDVQNA